jgi:hypothetical protein
MKGGMNMKLFKTWWIVAGVLLINTGAWAHVPYLEDSDFSTTAPFKCQSALQSTAVYAWLENYADVDYYNLTAYTSIPFFAELIVPVFDVYANFRPSMALIGPCLPVPTELLPVPLAPGEGAIVLHDDGLDPRPQFFEPFGNKSYYQGPRLEINLKPGKYRLIYWDPAGNTGDYVATIGKYEIWLPKNIIRAFKITPIIRAGGELHLP